MGGLPGIEVVAAKAALEVAKQAYKQGWFDRLVSAWRRKHRILVLGATGTGKTAFLESLSEAIPKAIDLMNRTEFVEKYRIRIAKHPFIFVDTPGQIRHKLRRKDAIKEVMQGSRISGVINVVSYGYHESRAVAKPEIKNNGKVSESFLKAQRRREIEMLDEWTPLLGGGENTDWLITVVTKADLWWKHRDAVMAYYESGAYHQALGEAQSLKPVVLPYCSIFQMFYEQGAMSGDFEDAARIQAKAQMVRGLLAAIGNEHHA